MNSMDEFRRNATEHHELRREYVSMHEVLPEAKNDRAVIEHFELSPEQVAALQGRKPIEYSGIEAGETYTRLRPRGEDGPVMTDTPMERATNVPFLRHATGDILISGLGIGMVLLPALKRDHVRSVTVIEAEPAIIDLVEEPIRSYSDHAEKLHVHEGDVFDFVPEHDLPDGVPDQYDCIYHDIWPTIDADNYREMKRLTKRFLYCLKDDGWIGCWREQDVRQQHEQKQHGSILSDVKKQLKGQIDDDITI